MGGTFQCESRLYLNRIRSLEGVNVALDKYNLAMQKRSMLWRNSGKICVLKPITTTFESGILNVIMGPSGSGKNISSLIL